MYVKIKSSHGKISRNLTIGKSYKTIDYHPSSTVYEATFTIVSDNGQHLFCLLKNCGHLIGGDWEIVEKKIGYLSRIYLWFLRLFK